MKRLLVLAAAAALLGLSACGPKYQAAMELGLKNYPEAINLYNQHLSQDPGDWKARGRLGFAYLKNGQFPESIKEYRDVLKQRPGDPFAVLYIGLAHLNNDQIGEAMDAWQGFNDPTQPLVQAEIQRQLTLLMIAKSQREAKKALEQEKSLSAAPDPNAVAVCYYQDLSKDKSLAAFQKALAAMVITDLKKLGKVKVVERLRLQALLEEMKLGQTGIVDEASAPRVGRLLGAEHVVVGNLSVGSINAVTTVASASKG
ncbi:MAG: tetratricopeptide repeat protein, partial [Desulfovibrionaceae bacterium]|nr:tetratricopeptide repeat protein [Desulfovibrionaceae bacterium]